MCRFLKLALLKTNRMNTRYKMSAEDRKAKLQVLRTRLNNSLELIGELKSASVMVQRYEQAGTEREIEKFLEQALERVEGLLEL